MKLEGMAEFFAARVEGYDRHMIENVEGCREGYALMAILVPETTRRLLDLGCGTGLELEPIFQRFPALRVTGIDLSRAMLDKLREKFPDKALELVCGDYFQTNLGTGQFDCAVSFETMHHFAREDKLSLYRRVWESLIPGGCYIECDWMVLTQEEEDLYRRENERLRREQDIPREALCHFDIPFTVENQIAMLKEAGFAQAEAVFRQGGTTIVVART